MKNITTIGPALPITLRRPTATLTPKGHAVLALYREQAALPISDAVGRAHLDRLISTLLEVAPIAETVAELAEQRMQRSGPLTVRKESWL